jgi:hypothetical protein
MLSHEEGSKLHDKVAKAYKESIELMHAEGEFNAALLNGARQFLRDNNVVMDSGMGTPLQALANDLNTLPFEEEETPRDTAQATGL